MATTKITLPAVEIPESSTLTSAGRLIVPGISIAGREVEIDPGSIAALMACAREAAASAYAPFSRFPVGSAVVMADDAEGEMFCGSNVENSSYGGTVCAERGAIFAAAGKGFRRLRWLAVSTVNTLDAPLCERSPCGLCRQVIREFADEHTLVFCDRGEPDMIGDVFDIERLLPFGFQFAPTEGI